MPMIEISEGVHIHYEEYGEGDKTVICSMIDYPRYSSIRDLCKFGYHVYLLTNRGFGKSDHSDIDYGAGWWDIWAGDVIRFADKRNLQIRLCRRFHGQEQDGIFVRITRTD